MHQVRSNARRRPRGLVNDDIDQLGNNVSRNSRLACQQLPFLSKCNNQIVYLRRSTEGLLYGAVFSGSHWMRII
jgi:hypothetical protein